MWPVVIAFWASAAVLFYTFLGYGCFIRWLARATPRPWDKAGLDAHVSVVVVVHNEERRIRARLENLLASDYPAEHLEILVVSDGSTDATPSVVESFANVRLLKRGTRTGKAACLNAALAEASGSIVVFADARQQFAPGTIRELVANFADPSVGAVSGALEIVRSEKGAGSGLDRYWDLEKKIRHAEAKFDSCIGCTGAVYAIRRTLFTPIPEETILDDVLIPMTIATRGYRVVFDPSAWARDTQPLEPALEKIRKQRTLAGNFQLFAQRPEWVLPWRNRLWWQLISHKLLRLAAPLFLLTVLVSSALLSHGMPYLAAFLIQSSLYLLGVVGLLLPGKRIRFLSVPAGFLFLNLMTVRGFLRYLKAPGAGSWQSATK